MKAKVNIRIILSFWPIIILLAGCSSKTELRYPGLRKVPVFQSEVRSIHPICNHLYPLAIAENDTFYIYDIDTTTQQYHFVKKTPTPMPIPEGIRASFPLSDYHNEPACIVTPEIFASRDGYVTIFHEFVHCYQYETCEPELKAQLQIYQEAMAATAYSWEINYPFPYADSQFVDLYAGFLAALNQGNANQISLARKQLYQYLALKDYEYMVWQEWKEGLARYLENQLQQRLGLELNRNGSQKPYRRVTFYAGGARFIEHLLEREPGLSRDIKGLFYRMLNYYNYQLTEG